MENSTEWQKRQINRLTLLARSIERNAPKEWRKDGSLKEIIIAIKILQSAINLIARSDAE